MCTAMPVARNAGQTVFCGGGGHRRRRSGGGVALRSRRIAWGWALPLGGLHGRDLIGVGVLEWASQNKSSYYLQAMNKKPLIRFQ